MKRSLFLPLLFFSFFLHAQSVILLEQDSISQVNVDVDISNEFEDFPLNLFFKNNTDEIIQVHWQREFADYCPLEWQVISADQLMTYIPDVDASLFPIAMNPTDSHFIMQQLFLPKMVPGCCDIRMIFTLEGEPDTPIDTGYYHIEINSDACFVTSTYQSRESSINLYPNPVQDKLFIENPSMVKQLELLDLNGNVHLNQEDFSGEYIDLSALPAGVYFCKITRISGKVFVRKVIKK